MILRRQHERTACMQMLCLHWQNAIVTVIEWKLTLIWLWPQYVLGKALEKRPRKNNLAKLMLWYTALHHNMFLDLDACTQRVHRLINNDANEVLNWFDAAGSWRNFT